MFMSYCSPSDIRSPLHNTANASPFTKYSPNISLPEARTHGAGFVNLSTDQETRLQQQEMLRELHETSKAVAKQHKAETRRKQKTMAERLKKIRQRKRLKRGLPMNGVYFLAFFLHFLTHYVPGYFIKTPKNGLPC